MPTKGKKGAAAIQPGALWLLRLQKDGLVYRMLIRAPTVGAARKVAAKDSDDPAWEDPDQVVHTRIREAGTTELILYAES